MSSSVEESDLPEEEVFEITDFTNATDWELFISKIEEVIGEWHLNSYTRTTPLCAITNEMRNGTWETRTADISFTGVPFTLTYHQLKEVEHEHEDLFQEEPEEDGVDFPAYSDDMMNLNTDFPPRAHCLARWYGLRSFLVLSPPSGSESNLSESKCNLLRSSAAVALNNSSCHVPFFVQILESWRRVFSGHAYSVGVQTQFEMVHLKHCPQQYRNISGLLHVFKTKIGSPSLPMGRCWVSTRFTYVLNDWGDKGKWPLKLQDPQEVAMNFATLMSGSLDEPVMELQLAAMWPNLTSDLIMDNDVHTHFNALAAPVWAVRLRYSDDLPCLLTYYLYEFMKGADRKESLSDLLSFENHSEQEPDMGLALGRITEPAASSMIPIVSSRLASGISKAVSDPQGLLRRSAHSLTQMGASQSDNKMPEATLKAIREFLFRSLEKEPSKSAYDLSHQLKAAPLQSFTHKFATCAMVVNLCHGGIHGIAHLWHVIVTELRTLWDAGKLIPGIGMNVPDLRTCLLHQKFQMLNCCVNHKTIREQKRKSASEIKEDNQIPTENVSEDSNIPSVFENKVVSEDMEQIEENVEKSDENESQNLKNESKNVETRFTMSASDDSDDEFYECESDVDLEEVEDVEEKEDVSEAQPESSFNDGQVPTSSETDEKKEEVSMPQRDKDEQNDDHHSVSQVEEDKPMDDGYVAQKDKDCDGDMEVKRSLINEAPSEKFPPEGRLKQCGSLHLLLNISSPLYIPITQDHAPLTEDQLEEQANLFSKLGDTKEGSKVRARMQSASLLSDMQSFKAANPGCCLGDFVRWYSPRDFEEGKLSQRMKIPGNLWETTWEQANPIPAHRQKRLFDDTKEAEKVLHFLANLKPAEVMQAILPVCVHEAVSMLRSSSKEMSECLPDLPLLCNQIETKATQTFRGWNMYGSVANQFKPWSIETRGKIEDILRQISFADALIQRAQSLQHKFSDLGDPNTIKAFVKSIMEHPEITIEGGPNGPVGKIITQYFTQQVVSKIDPLDSELQKDEPPKSRLPDPTGREFIIRAISPYPSNFSREMPHRLYAVLMRNEFRLASAISTDPTFF
uniref:rab3 GTPase-activating protein catalytic subunit-like n=1 Tax=Ciona intestinalis TaxID=7719 RepID=UPI000180CC86|nr:rab3 GTPase-activating protein catalytic subunit-like [Ciona intestinalis]|eukprot:XP_002123946.1 rab3 GTPase-activating protein catalytic subunit-like [Ciona intestinalis]